jgi:hypothetical protein
MPAHIAMRGLSRTSGLRPNLVGTSIVIIKIQFFRKQKQKTSPKNKKTAQFAVAQPKKRNFNRFFGQFDPKTAKKYNQKKLKTLY